MSAHGFVLRETRFVKELNADVNIYLHPKSGARLMHVASDDPNKVFAVSFRTPPSNSTGVAHILEHSVLCGSEKYPAKDTFVELLKGSLHTFLNAMTADDWTSYPVASMNDKDFYQLSEVYLDAVFFPNITKIDEIFYQEGWHFELDNKEDDLSIKGVVYNEMKGAYSEPFRIMDQLITETLLPDTIYKHDSGGKPENIPDLSLEEFREFHAKYYHPSNSYFFLYGNVNLDDMLAMIDKEALSKFHAKEIESSITPQTILTKPIELESFYPISKEENDDDKTWFAISFLLDLKNNPSLYFSFEVISHLLLQTPAAPLKNALLKSGICKDVVGNFSDNTIQPSFRVIIKDCKLESKEKFKQIFYDTLKELCKDGIDKQLIDASISIKEFNLREAEMGHYPKGFFYLLYLLSDWIHDKDPINPLCYEDVLVDTKMSLTTNFYETLIQKFILENNHHCFITMKPEKGLVEKNEAKLKEELDQKKANLSDTQIQDIIDIKKKVLERQTTPSKEEDLKKIPALTLNDINVRGEDFSVIFNRETQERVDGSKISIPYLEHPTFTNGIVYLSLHFFVNSLPQNLIQYARLMSQVMGKISTEKHHYSELSNLVYINTGGFYYTFDSYENYHKDDVYSPHFSIYTKAVFPKTEPMIKIIDEVLKTSIFNDSTRLKEILNELKSYMEMMLMNSGITFAEKRLEAYYSQYGGFNETVSGIEYYFFLKKLLLDFDNNKDEIIKNLYVVRDHILSNHELQVSITAPEEEIKRTKGLLSNLVTSFKMENAKYVKYNFDFSTNNEAFILPGMVQYVSKGYSFKKKFPPNVINANSPTGEPLNINYHGAMAVLSNLLKMDYLWNEVRVKGGAYGTYFKINYTGSVVASSYRDPNLLETLNIYDTIADYLHKQMDNQSNFDKFIIGVIGKIDIPMSANIKSQYSNYYHFIEKYSTSIQKERHEILNSCWNRMASYASMIDELMKMNHYCVFGSENKIRENSGLFNKIINVFS